MIFKNYEDFVIGFHYSRFAVLEQKTFKGNEWGSNYSVDELRELSFMNVDMLENFIRLIDKMEEELSIDYDDLHVRQTDDSYLINYKDYTIELLKSFIKWARNDLKSDNSVLRATSNIESEMVNKAQNYYNSYPNIADMPIEDVLLFVDSNNQHRLGEFVGV